MGRPVSEYCGGGRQEERKEVMKALKIVAPRSHPAPRWPAPRAQPAMSAHASPSGSFSMTLGRKEPLRLVRAPIATPIGPLVLVAEEGGALFMAEFADCEARMDRWLQRRLASAQHSLAAGAIAARIGEAFKRYFS